MEEGRARVDERQGSGEEDEEPCSAAHCGPAVKEAAAAIKGFGDATE